MLDTYLEHTKVLVKCDHPFPKFDVEFSEDECLSPVHTNDEQDPLSHYKQEEARTCFFFKQI